MAHHVVVDLEHTRDLVERLALGAEREQVVDAVGLLVDLVGELAAAPDVLAVPPAATLLDQVAGALDDLFLPLVRHFGVQHEQDLVVDHGFPSTPSFGLRRPRRQACTGTAHARRGRKRLLE